ncbi:BRCA1-associated RING domain protein 1-like [Rhopalosiphum maidis]|uniref:BRCA1-associated RING domain protein 1-like n=1 Tax=Rhopalosiphum maidis TaxID=43146 RepID=UPI000EFFE03C|nr:BRCA1-associated RING domain protein 1-like [Rhopalosiphum maidis]
MELALSEEPETLANGQTTECSAKLMSTSNNKSLCMKRIKTPRESEIYLFNSEYLKNNYDKYIRDDFLYAFGAFYCDKVMNIPHLDCALKTECYHRETELNYRHYEFATYMENIVSWLDHKLKYINGESSKCNKKPVDQLFNTNYIQQNTTEISLLCKPLESNTCSSQEQNNKLRSVTKSPNEIIATSDITTPKQDLPKNSTYDHKTEIIKQNTQNELITLPDLTSPKHDTPRSSPNDYKKGIDMVNNTQNKLITSPDLTFPRHDTPRSSPNNHEKEIDMVLYMITGDLTSPKHDTSRSLHNVHKKGIDVVNKIIKSPDLTTSLQHDTSRSSHNDHKKGIYMENNQSDIITLQKHNAAKSTTKDFKKRINKSNSNLVNISSTADSKLTTKSQLKNSDINGGVKESTSDHLKSNTNEKVVNESKLNSAHKNAGSFIGEEKSNLCLETPTTVRSTRQTNKTTTTLLKRSNSVIDSEQSSKKKKIENPSPSDVERKTNNNKNSEKALNESIKQVSKHLYSRNSKGETKLHSACAKGKLSLVISLLDDGFNPNVKDNAGWTPMHEAVKSGNLDIVKELIKYGAYLNVPGFEYESPLYTAIKYGKFEIAKTILDYGADVNFINMYGNNVRCLNEEKLSELMENQVSCKSTQIINYKLEEIVIVLNNVSLKSETVNTFCKQFNIKLVQNVLNEKKFNQVTHMIVSKTTNNTCDVNLECLIGIANGLFIIDQNWISDSLDKSKLMDCENYEVSGTTLFADCNGPKISRISKQKLYPKLFDGINIHISGNNGWNQFKLEHLKKLVIEFGAKLLIRMPNPEDCPSNIIPYHCRNNEQMFHVSNIILYTMDSNRLIKYNMKHLKAFHISWFMEAIQKYII